MDPLRVAADQMVPERQVLAFGNQAIAAGRRQPLELVGLRRGELDTVGDETDALGVVGAAAALQVEQLAGDTRVVDAAVVLVLELLQAAQAATVAQRLPLVLVELGEGLAFPEGFDFGGHGIGGW
ncbi:hypothetical protein K652_12161 [Pseudomonas aeruginosa VRFPA02]|nr:hypothetical protein K652_12161 [Pseudomonas aeruginosa VRFPA02]